MICALTLSACMSGQNVQCLKPLPPPAWMVQDPPDWRKTLNKIMYVSSDNWKPSKP
ncbi:Rz1 family lipoprotein, partial [Xenorhabdus szentirmaii]|uniref:Rz1 family lipoprotein n=1 Tax=Xenorhabdus szentirmaii TaxID=290112 RepID=UPI002B4082D6